jgi:hypothetical protein
VRNDNRLQANRIEASLLGSTGAVSGLFAGASAGEHVYRTIDSLRASSADKTAEKLMNALMTWSGHTPNG